MLVFAEARDGAWQYADVTVTGGPDAAVVSWKGEPVIAFARIGELTPQVVMSWRYAPGDWRVEPISETEIAIETDMTLNAMWGEGMRRRS